MEGKQLDKTELLSCEDCGKVESECICAAATQHPEQRTEQRAEQQPEQQPLAEPEDSDKTRASGEHFSRVSNSDSEFQPFDPWIGKTIRDQYEIVSLIARGGMGAVYRARHILLGTDRAIKVIRPDLHRDDVVYQRFKQEAQAVEGLSHPNIISFYDYGVFEFAPYVVMDLVDGQALDAVIKSSGKMEITTALNVFVQIAGALEHAHNKGILHRDIKPSNIMLVKDDSGQLSPMLLDFGIAKIQSVDGQKITSTGEIFGSPSYMSPEQGKGQATDAGSDIYSLGCVMYESMTGKPPFEGRNAIETIMQHLNAPVPKMPVSQKLAEDPVWKDFEAIIMRCLEKEPGNRYMTMASLHEDLKRLSYGERLLKLQEEIASRKRAGLFYKVYKYALIAFAISIIPYAVFSVFIDPAGWRKELMNALEDQDNADKMIQQIISDLNPKDELFKWNKAFLLWNQAQVYRLRSADNRMLMEFAIQDYKQAIQLLSEFAKEKSSPPRLARQLTADCLDGLARSFMKKQEWESPALREALINEAMKSTEPGIAEIDSKNTFLAALAAVYESEKLRRQVMNDKTAKNELPLAGTLELKARALVPFNDLKKIDKTLEEQEELLRNHVHNSWEIVDCLVNRAQVSEGLNLVDDAIKKLKEAKELELDLYKSARDPFVLNIQNNIDRLEKKKTGLLKK